MERNDVNHSNTASYDILLERYLNTDPAKVALATRNSSLASHIKYLQRAKHKLPSWYAARCVITQQLFEQSSSETVAKAKFEGINGERALDLTCGLGVDSAILSTHFKEVTSIELDPEKVKTATENFKRLGISNISVRNNSAEDYCAQIDNSSEKFDLVYLDPSRINGDKRVFSIEDCSPNFISLLPTLLKVTAKITVKLSPLFDIDELCRLFGVYYIEIQVISLNNECKEVLLTIITNKESNLGEVPIKHTIINSSGVSSYTLFRDKAKVDMPYNNQLNYNYLAIPNVVFYKTRMIREYVEYIGLNCSILNYIYTTDNTFQSFEGQVFKIERQVHFSPKTIKSKLKEMGIKSAQIYINNFPYQIEEIRKILKIKAGDDARLIFTTINEKLTVFFVTLQ